MSWDSYIDNLIIRSSNTDGTHCDKACIVGLEDGSQWTTDAHANALVLKPEERNLISKCFKKKDFTDFQAGGVWIGGVKYRFLREEDKSVYAKLKDNGAISMTASKKAIIVGHCPEGKQQGKVNLAVSAIADYLESMDM